MRVLHKINLMFFMLISMWCVLIGILFILFRMAYSISATDYGAFAQWADEFNEAVQGIPYIVWVLIGGILIGWAASHLTWKFVNKMLVRNVEDWE